MCTYQRWCHWNGAVGEFGLFLVLGACGEVYGTIGVKRGRHPCMGQYLPMKPYQQHPHHHCLQKAPTHRPISTLGQQPLHHSRNSVFNILAQRAKAVSTNQQALQLEMEHIRKSLQTCSFPPCALNILHSKFNCRHNLHSGQTSTDNQPNNSGINNNNKNISIVVPCIHGLGKGSKGHATIWESRYISRVQAP